jgi:hypothetical protein
METIPEIMDVALQLLESSGSSTRCYKHHTHNNKKYNDKNLWLFSTLASMVCQLN